MPRYGIKINRLDGGLNTKTPRIQGELNESPSCLNVVYDDLGAVGTRMGNTSIGSVGTSGPDNMHSYHNDDGTSHLMAWCDSTAYYRNTAGSLLACEGSDGVMTAGVNVVSHNMQNYAFFANGYNNYKWDGTYMSRWGMDTPGALGDATHYAGSATSVLTTAAVYKLTHEDIFGTETLATSEVSADDTNGSSGDYGLQFAIPSISTALGVSYVNMYRKLSDGTQSQFYLLSSVTNTGSAITIQDGLDESLSTSQIYDVTVDPKPPSITCMVEHIGYMFAASKLENPTYLYYSYINNPSKFSAARFIRIGEGDGIPIRSLAVYGSNVIIAKEDGYGYGSVWLLYTPDGEPLNWSLSRLDMAYGNVSPKAMARFAQFMTLLNQNGIYDLNQQVVGATVSDPISWKIEPDILALSQVMLEKSVAVNFKNKVYFSVAVDSNSQNDTIYVYDYVRGRAETSRELGAWSKFENWELSDMVEHDGELYGASYNGQIYELRTGHSDNGVAIDSNYTTMTIRGLPEHEENEKIWRYAHITHSTPGDWNMTVTYGDDLQSVAGNTESINLNPGGSTWGTAVWGEDFWGPGTDIQTTKIVLSGMNSRYIQLRFSSNAVDEYWKVYNILLEYNLRGIR